MQFSGAGIIRMWAQASQRESRTDTGEDREVGFTLNDCFEAELFKEKDLSFSDLDVLMAQMGFPW